MQAALGKMCFWGLAVQEATLYSWSPSQKGRQLESTCWLLSPHWASPSMKEELGRSIPGLPQGFDWPVLFQPLQPCMCSVQGLFQKPSSLSDPSGSYLLQVFPSSSIPFQYSTLTFSVRPNLNTICEITTNSQSLLHILFTFCCLLHSFACMCIYAYRPSLSIFHHLLVFYTMLLIIGTTFS